MTKKAKHAPKVMHPEQYITGLLKYLGENPNRQGLAETPRRVIEAWNEWTWGYDREPGDVMKTFEDGAEGVDEIVFVGSIPVYSMCEHHMAPFFGVAHIGYLPNGRIVGLSKLSRLADIFARRLTIQERITNQIANALDEHLKPRAVGVVLRCRHLCMESRGINRAKAITYTSALRGVFRSDQAIRSEFMSFVQRADATSEP